MKRTPPSSNGSSVLPAYLLMVGILAFGVGSAYMVLRSEGARPGAAVVHAPVASLAAAAAAAPSTPAASPAAQAAASVPSSASSSNNPSATPAAAEPAATPVPVSAPVAVPTPVEATVSATKATAARAAAKAPAPRRAAAHVQAESVEPVKVRPPKAPEGDNEPLPRTAPKAEKPLDSAVRVEPVKDEAVKAAPKLEAGSIKPLTAPALVPVPSEPRVVAATEERAYVRLDEKRTVIVKKGDSVQGLGAYQGLEGSKAKFDSGSLPITSQ